MNTIRVMLADDHTLVRAGIRVLLEGLSHVRVVAETGDGAEVLDLAANHRPDIVLMDISMGGMNGLEATARLKAKLPGTKVIILSAFAQEEYVLEALRSGASGYILKDAATNELELAIDAVMAGQSFLSPRVSKQVIESYVTRSGGESSPIAALSPRQREILQLIAEGHSTKEIAFRLKVSIKTVESHRSQLMQRLDIHDVAGLVRYAVRAGLIRADR